MEPLDRKLRNLESIAVLKEIISEDIIDRLTARNKALCHPGKSEVSPHLPPRATFGLLNSSLSLVCLSCLLVFQPTADWIGARRRMMNSSCKQSRLSWGGW